MVWRTIGAMGCNGYSFSDEDAALFQFDQEAKSGWQVPNLKKTCNHSCQKEQACGGRNSELVTRGLYAALAGSQDRYDLDIPLPLMMVQDEGDVPLNPVTKEQIVVP